MTWGIDLLSRKPVPGFENALSKEMFPYVESEPPLVQLWTISTCSITGSQGEEVSTSLSSSPPQGAVGSNEIYSYVLRQDWMERKMYSSKYCLTLLFKWLICMVLFSFTLENTAFKMICSFKPIFRQNSTSRKIFSPLKLSSNIFNTSNPLGFFLVEGRMKKNSVLLFSPWQ